MENLLSHAGIFFTMAAVLTFEAILLRLASEPEGGREVKARKGESHLGAFIRENWYWLLLLFCALGGKYSINSPFHSKNVMLLL